MKNLLMLVTLCVCWQAPSMAKTAICYIASGNTHYTVINSNIDCEELMDSDPNVTDCWHFMRQPIDPAKVTAAIRLTEELESTPGFTVNLDALQTELDALEQSATTIEAVSGDLDDAVFTTNPIPDLLAADQLVRGLDATLIEMVDELESIKVDHAGGITISIAGARVSQVLSSVTNCSAICGTILNKLQAVAQEPSLELTAQRQPDGSLHYFEYNVTTASQTFVFGYDPAQQNTVVTSEQYAGCTKSS